jgi:membrane-associated phospholipid phosphatase
MQTKKTLFIISTWVSTLGHPLLTVAVFILFSTFHLFTYTTAFVMSATLFGLVILPITVWNYLKTKQGQYANFDVSIRPQRYSMYLLIIGLLTGTTLVFFATNQPASFCYGMLFSLGLFIISFVSNFFIKVSLHTALSVFLSIALMAITLPLGIAMTGFAVAIALSRYILKRHTISEIIAGMMIGIGVGSSLYYFLIQKQV